MYIKSVKFHELMNLLHKNRIKQCLVVREDKGVPIFFLGQNGKKLGSFAFAESSILYSLSILRSKELKSGVTFKHLQAYIYIVW